MIGDQIVSLIWFGLATVLVGSALVARRLSLKRTIWLALAWVGVFAVAIAIATVTAPSFEG